jgi:hypothetical protein
MERPNILSFVESSVWMPLWNNGDDAVNLAFVLFRNATTGFHDMFRNDDRVVEGFPFHGGNPKPPRDNRNPVGKSIQGMFPRIFQLIIVPPRLR